MNSWEFLTFRVEGRVAILSLNRPPHNILNTAMCIELITFLESFEESDRDKYDYLLITTEGDHFCAGADVGEHLPGKLEQMLPRFDQLMLSVSNCAIPTVAAIKGTCMGGGMELARACYRTVGWNMDTVVLGVPEIKLACFPPFALATFTRHANDLVMEDMIRFLLGGKILKGKIKAQAEHAVSLGLIDEVHEGDLSSLINLVRSMDLSNYCPLKDGFGFKSRISEGLIRSALLQEPDLVENLSTHALMCGIDVLADCASTTDLAMAMEFAQHTYLTKLARHPDYSEGLTAFLEKRKPVFKATGLATR